MHRSATITCLALSAILALGGSHAKAADQFDASARARLISRFVVPETVAVGHVDVTRLKVDSLFALLKRALPAGTQQMEFTQAAAEQSVEQFLKAGGREAFIVIAPGVLPLLVVPVPEGADEAAILAILGQAPLETVEKIDGALVAGPDEAVARLRTTKPEPRPALAKALAAAGDTLAQLVVLPTDDNRKVIAQLLPQLPPELGGASTRPISSGLNWLALGIDGTLSLRVVIDATDAAAAGELKDLLASVLDAVFKQPQTQQLFPDQAAIRKLLRPTVSGNRLVLTLGSQELVEQLAIPLERARGAASQSRSTNNLKQLGLAMHTYYETHKSFPPAMVAKDGKPLLSWRVLVLPYLEEEKLYKEFHLDEPWDSAHNKPLIARMPAVFRSPLAESVEIGRTVYLTPRSPESAFPGSEGVKFAQITDGTSNTIMLVEADDEHAVIWTRPDDWDFDAEHPARGLRLISNQGYLAGFCDGSVRLLDKQIKPGTLGALITRAGGEAVPADAN